MLEKIDYFEIKCGNQSFFYSLQVNFVNFIVTRKKQLLQRKEVKLIKFGIDGNEAEGGEEEGVGTQKICRGEGE